jgi:thioredoxin reductase (NADPH)
VSTQEPVSPAPESEAPAPVFDEAAVPATEAAGTERAPRPAILVVDDEPSVLRAVQRDLRRRFGEDHRVLRAESGAEALELLDELGRRGEPVALLVADQRMPQMDGVQFLTAARERVPDARKVLLTAYADTEAAIKAINDVSLDYYLLKPWDPPEEKLFPVVTDLLDDWKAQANATFGGVRVVGHRFSRDSHAAKDFLARNQVPYRWVDVEQDDEARRLLEACDCAEERLPVIVLPDGQALVQPTMLALAEQIGLSTEAQLPFYDLVIVGGGPAGLGAAVYGASEGLRTVMVEREAPGGQAGQSSRIENYLGFPTGLSGGELARRATTQARRFGAEILAVQDVTALRTEGLTHVLTLSDGKEISAHTVLIATGVAYRMLDAPGMAELTGTGVYYGAAMTEALSCSNQDVVIVGGANSAGQAAVYFARYARRVTMLVRGPDLKRSMSSYLIDQIAAIENIVVRTGAQVASVSGEGRLEAVRVLDVDGSEADLAAAALFVFIGAAPRTDWLGPFVERDEHGFILTGLELLRDGKPGADWPLERDPFALETSTPGLFAAGDVRSRSIKRVASSVGEGAMAVQLIHQYLSTQ